MDSNRDSRVSLFLTNKSIGKCLLLYLFLRSLDETTPNTISKEQWKTPNRFLLVLVRQFYCSKQNRKNLCIDFCIKYKCCYFNVFLSDSLCMLCTHSVLHSLSLGLLLLIVFYPSRYIDGAADASHIQQTQLVNRIYGEKSCRKTNKQAQKGKKLK